MKYKKLQVMARMSSTSIPSWAQAIDHATPSARQARRKREREIGRARGGDSLSEKPSDSPQQKPSSAPEGP